MKDTKLAPWTVEEVELLNDEQLLGKTHPYTCDQGHNLIALMSGWVCSNPICEYTQNYYVAWS